MTNRSLTNTVNVPKSLSIQPDNPNWREAASLMILSKDDRNKEFDYSMLMVKRSGKSSFMASALVFPGGVIELFDFDSSWYDLFAGHGIDKKELDSTISQQITGPRLPIIGNPLAVRSAPVVDRGYLNPDIALRISAIRETFEEAGEFLTQLSK